MLRNTEPGQFGESQHFAVGDVTDGDLADERHQMVLAHGEHLDIFDHHHLVVVFVEHGIVQNVCKKTIQSNVHKCCIIDRARRNPWPEPIKGRARYHQLIQIRRCITALKNPQHQDPCRDW